MLHDPVPGSRSHDGAAGDKARIGLRLFAFYLLIYAGFVAINLLRPQWMKARIALGMNLAVLYGFALITLPIVLGLIYNRWCSALEERARREGASADAAGREGGDR